MRLTHATPIVVLLLGIVLPGATKVSGADAPFGRKPFYLVARDTMPDPMFQESVILMFPSPPASPIVSGVIVNKPTRVTLDELFHQLGGLNHRDEPAYFGGPVDDNLPLLIMRGTRPQGPVTQIIDDLYATASVGAMSAVLTRPWSPKDCRVFFGRAQWTPDQLRGEILRGAWDVVPLDVGLIFGINPKSVWRALATHSHEREVSFRPVIMSSRRSISP